MVLSSCPLRALRGQQVYGGIGDGGCNDPTGWSSDSALHEPIQPAGVHPMPKQSAAMMMMAAAAAAAAAAVAGGFGPGQAVQRQLGTWPPTVAQFPPIPLPQQQQQQQQQLPRPPPPLPPGYVASASQGSQQHLAPGGGHANWTSQPWQR